jgi:hypothetical protein
VFHADFVVNILIENGKNNTRQRGEQNIVELHHQLVEARLSAPGIERRKEELDESIPANCMKKRFQESARARTRGICKKYRK